MGWISRLIFGEALQRGGHLTNLDRQKNKDAWIKIQVQLTTGKPSSLKVAILDADKLVDGTLRVIYPRELTLGERLKLAKDLFRNPQVYEDLWYAHKVRNLVAHEINYDLPSFEAQNVLVKYRQALVDLGAL